MATSTAGGAATSPASSPPASAAAAGAGNRAAGDVRPPAGRHGRAGETLAIGAGDAGDGAPAPAGDHADPGETTGGHADSGETVGDKWNIWRDNGRDVGHQVRPWETVKSLLTQ